MHSPEAHPLKHLGVQAVTLAVSLIRTLQACHQCASGVSEDDDYVAARFPPLARFSAIDKTLSCPPHSIVLPAAWVPHRHDYLTALQWLLEQFIPHHSPTAVMQQMDML